MKAPLLERPQGRGSGESDSGSPLPAQVRQVMEAGIGHDFSAVRLHSDRNAAAKADRLSAIAFTKGEHVYFATSQLQPDTPRGQHLLAHELTHVVQQRAASPVSGSGPGRNRTANLGAEREADATAARVVAGRVSTKSAATDRRTPIRHRHSGVQCQDRNGPPVDAPPVPAKKPDPLTEGLQVVGEELAKNEQVKAKIIEPLKERAKAQFDLIDPADKKALIIWAAGTYVLSAGSLLSDPKGRTLLSDVNLVAPLALIPNSILTDVRYVLPSEKVGERHQFGLKLGFDVPLRLTFFKGCPPILVNSRLAFDVTGAHDVDTEIPLVSAAHLKLKVGEVEIKGGYELGLNPNVRPNLNASVGIGKAVSISGGRYADVLPPTPIGYPDQADGHIITSKKSIPDYFKTPPVPDTRIMINVDIVELVNLFGGAKSKPRARPSPTIGVDERPPFR